jgi:hypothetical protein
MATEQTAQTARAEAGAVADTVKDETRQVAQQAQQQATNALHQIQGDVRTRANEEATKFAQTLHETSRQLQTMADHSGEQGFVASLVREGSNATERLGTRLDQGGLDAVMSDMRSWARRQPGTFLLGAVAAGFAVGRLVRNMRDDDASNVGDNGNGYRALPSSASLGDRLDPMRGVGGGGA